MSGGKDMFEGEGRAGIVGGDFCCVFYGLYVFFG